VLEQLGLALELLLALPAADPAAALLVPLLLLLALLLLSLLLLALLLPLLLLLALLLPAPPVLSDLLVCVGVKGPDLLPSGLSGHHFLVRTILPAEIDHPLHVAAAVRLLLTARVLQPRPACSLQAGFVLAALLPLWRRQGLAGPGLPLLAFLLAALLLYGLLLLHFLLFLKLLWSHHLLFQLVEVSPVGL
jgi:hypothetical protein